MTDPFLRNRSAYPRAHGIYSVAEDDEDVVVFDRNEDLSAYDRAQPRCLAGASGDGGSSEVTHTTSALAREGASMHRPTLRPLPGTGRETVCVPPAGQVRLDAVEDGSCEAREAHPRAQAQGQQQQQAKAKALSSPCSAHALSPPPFAVSPSPPAASGSGAADTVVTMDAAVRVPRALRTAAARRTMFDVLLERKEREAAAREDVRRRTLSTRDATLTELFEKQRRQPHVMGISAKHGEGGGMQESTTPEAVTVAAEQRKQNSEGAPCSMHAPAPLDPNRRLRQLLPAHLSKEGRERAVALAIERRKQEAAEKAMALDISDFSSTTSTSSSSSSRSRSREGGPDAEGDRARPLVQSMNQETAKRASGKATILSLLHPHDDSEASGDGDGRAARQARDRGARRSPTRQQPRSPPRRSVIDLFHATEAHTESPPHRRAAPPSSAPQSTRRVRASDVLEQDMDAYDTHAKKHPMAAVASGRPSRPLETDPYDPSADPRTATTSSSSQLNSDLDDGTEAPPTERRRTKRLSELIEEEPANDEADTRAQQAQWLASVWGARAPCEQTCAVRSAEGHRGEDGLSPPAVHGLPEGLGIVGKPVGLGITSVAAAAHRRHGTAVDAALHGSAAHPLERRGCSRFMPSALSQSSPLAWAGPSAARARAELAVVPRLAIHPRELSGGARATGVVAATANTGRPHSFGCPTAARIVEYLRDSFDRWRINAQALLRELAQAEAASAEASARVGEVVAAIAASGGSGGGSDHFRSSPSDGVHAHAHAQAHVSRRHSRVDAVLRSALSPAAEDDDDGGCAPTDPCSHVEDARTCVAGKNLADPPCPAPTLEGSGVDVKLRVSYADAAFGLRRIVGDLEWVSTRAARRCGLTAALPATTRAAVCGGLETLLARRPDPDLAETRRWTVVVPEHVFEAVPLSMGHWLYLGEPFLVLRGARTLVASYTLTTDVLVTRAVRAGEAVWRDAVEASRRPAAPLPHPSLTPTTTPAAAAVEERGVYTTAPPAHATDGGVTPVPPRQDRRRPARGWGSDEDSSSSHSRDSGGGLGRGGRSLSQSASKTPFHSRLYDPLAFPGLTAVDGQTEHCPPRRDRGVGAGGAPDGSGDHTPRQLFAPCGGAGQGSATQQPPHQHHPQQEWEERDPAGVGFARGPGPDWAIPVDVLHVLVAAAGVGAPLPQPSSQGGSRAIEGQG